MTNLKELYEIILKMKPDTDFNILMTQLFYRQRIFTLPDISNIFYRIGEGGHFYEGWNYANNKDDAECLLMTFVPPEARVSRSSMSFLGKTTFTVTIDHYAQNIDSVYITVSGDSESFVLSKALVLWKIQRMIKDGDEIDLDSLWFDKGN